MSKKQKYLFVYLKTGGGHLAPARAVFNYMNKYFSDTTEPKLIYGFEESPRWVQYIIEDGYRILQYTGKWIFEFLYGLNKLPLVARITCNLLAPFMSKYLEKVITEEKPDKIVIFHFFLIIPVLRIIKNKNLTIPVETVITDPFTPHPMWFLKKKQNFIVFSDGLKGRVIRMNRNYSVQTFPFVIDETFSKLVSEDQIVMLKKKYGYEPGKKMLLIVGGGDGIPKGEKILKEILSSNPDYEIAIVCGKNEVLLKGSERLKEKNNADYLKIYGYVDFIYDLISISDVVLTKCGASTIMEILNLKKVPVVNVYIWEQELGNVDYLVEKNLGIYEPGIKKLPGVISNLLKDEKLYSFYKNNIEKEKIENGLPMVARHIMDETIP